MTINTHPQTQLRTDRTLFCMCNMCMCTVYGVCVLFVCACVCESVFVYVCLRKEAHACWLMMSSHTRHAHAYEHTHNHTLTNTYTHTHWHMHNTHRQLVLAAPRNDVFLREALVVLSSKELIVMPTLTYTHTHIAHKHKYTLISRNLTHLLTPFTLSHNTRTQTCLQFLHMWIILYWKHSSQIVQEQHPSARIPSLKQVCVYLYVYGCVYVCLHVHIFVCICLFVLFQS